jgi:CheY-like chemotaxis protein
VVVPKALSIILMDIEMPVMDGLTATRHIRGLQSEGTLVGHIPILAVTANARPDNVQSALDAGMDAVLTKPFRITELIEKMSDVVNVVGGPTSTEGMMPM